MSKFINSYSKSKPKGQTIKENFVVQSRMGTAEFERDLVNSGSRNISQTRSKRRVTLHEMDKWQHA